MDLFATSKKRNAVGEPASTKQGAVVTKMFLRFFLPSLVSTLGLALGGIADALVIGNVLGEEGLAAIGFTSPIYMVFNIFSVGIGVGGSILYSRFMSEGKASKALSLFNSSILFAVTLSLIIAVCGTLFIEPVISVLGASKDDDAVWEYTRNYASILFFAAPIMFYRVVLYYFIRSDDTQVLATVGMVVGNAVDIILNFVLIIGFDMGVAGAAYSTVIGVAVTAVIYSCNMLRKATILRFRIVKPQISLVLKSFKTGFASSSQYLFQFMTLALVNNLLMFKFGQTQVAVFDVVINISYVVFSIADAAGATLQPIISTFYGERNNTAIRLTFRLVITAVGLLAIPAVLYLYLFADNAAMLFGLTGGVATQAVRTFGISVFFAILNMVMGYYYQAAEQIKRSFVINISRTLVMYIIFACVCGFVFPHEFWWFFALTEVSTFIIWGIYGLIKRNFLCLPESDKEHQLEIAIENNDMALGPVIEQVEEFCEKWEADMKQTYYVTLTIEEICSSIITNAFKDKSKYIQLNLIADETDEGNTFTLHLRDNASSFNPFDLESKKMSKDDFSGLDNIGILMVKEKAKSFFYRRYQGFNTLVIKV